MIIKELIATASAHRLDAIGWELKIKRMEMESDEIYRNRLFMYLFSINGEIMK